MEEGYQINYLLSEYVLLLQIDQTLVVCFFCSSFTSRNNIFSTIERGENMTPEEFYAQVERNNEDYRNDRYQTYPGRYSDKWRQLKGREETAKYVMDVLYRVNLKSEHYLPPKEQDARRKFLLQAAEEVKRKIGRLLQSQSQERE
jgi:hypothetical protein